MNEGVGVLKFDLKIISNQNTFLEFDHIIDPSAPTHSTPLLEFTDGFGDGNTSNQNLTVTNQSTSDPDGDNVTNIIDWRLNGTSIAGLIMTFDTNKSNTTAAVIKDYSQYQNNGTLGGEVADAFPTWTTNGISGGAYNFDGKDDFIAVSNAAPSGSDNSLDFGKSGSSYSVEAWVNPSAVGDVYHIILIKRGLAGGNFPFTLYITKTVDGKTFQFEMYDGTNNPLVTSATIPLKLIGLDSFVLQSIMYHCSVLWESLAAASRLTQLLLPGSGKLWL